MRKNAQARLAPGARASRAVAGPPAEWRHGRRHASEFDCTAAGRYADASSFKLDASGNINRIGSIPRPKLRTSSGWRSTSPAQAGHGHSCTSWAQDESAHFEQRRRAMGVALSPLSALHHQPPTTITDQISGSMERTAIDLARDLESRAEGYVCLPSSRPR